MFMQYICPNSEIAIQGYEYEDIEILESPEEQQPITEPPVNEPAIGQALTMTTAAESMVPSEIASGDMPSSKVDSSTIKGSLAETVVAVVASHMEIVPVWLGKLKIWCVKFSWINAKLQQINTLIAREGRYPSPNLPFV